MPNQRLTPLAALAALLLCPLFALAQTVKMPAEVKVAPNRMAAVTIEYDGDEIKWTTPPELDVFREYDPDPKKIRLRLIGYTAGSFHVHAVTCRAGKLSDFATCTIVVGDPVPVPPGPTPGPGPGPGPTPPTPPTPAAPLDTTAVLMVYDGATEDQIPEKQRQVLFGQAARDYLDAHTPLEPGGKKHAWRIWPREIKGVENDIPLWQTAMKRPRQALPWVIISNGKTGYEGPLPATTEEFLALAKKYLGD